MANYNRIWTPEKIILEIQKRNRENKPLNSGDLIKDNNALYVASRVHFGTWKNALIASNIDYDEVMKRKSWTNDSIIEKIKELHDNGVDLSTKNMKMKYRPLYTAAGAKIHFGSWRAAVQASGIDYDSHVRVQFWNKDKIIKKIIELDDSGEDLSAGAVQRKYNSLAMAASHKRYFGSWKAAIEGAGLNYEEITNHIFWNKDKIIHKIQEMASNGEDISYSGIVKRYYGMYQSASKDIHFGSWENAVRAAGIDYDEVVKVDYWSKEKVVEEIVRLFNEGEDLSVSSIHNKFNTLLSAGSRYFGTWESAIYASGFDYENIRKVTFWDKGKIVNEIIRLKKLDEDLSVNAMQHNHNDLLQAASANRNFGSWKAAIEAAGFDYREIRKDSVIESYKGMIFEKYLEEMFSFLGRMLEVQKTFSFEHDKCRVDFYDPLEEEWIEAKLTSYTPSIRTSIQKYSKYSQKLTIIYLRGKSRKWKNPRVSFVSVKSYYDELKRLGVDDLVVRFQHLSKGYLTPEQRREALKPIDAYDEIVG